MPKYCYIAAVLIVVASPALAAEFFLVKDPSTQKCSVVTEKPEGAEIVGTAYATKEEARAAKKAAKASGECKKGDGKKDAD